MNPTAATDWVEWVRSTAAATDGAGSTSAATCCVGVLQLLLRDLEILLSIDFGALQLLLLGIAGLADPHQLLLMREVGGLGALQLLLMVLGAHQLLLTVLGVLQLLLLGLEILWLLLRDLW